MPEIKRAAYSKRCMISHRPPFRTAEPVFYRCPACGRLLIGNEIMPQHTDSPALPQEPQLVCCGQRLSPLPVLEGDEIPEGHKIGFTVFGGFENNAVRVTVDDGSHPMQGDHRIEWMYYRGFQGGQLKLLPPTGRSNATFSFADEDAYVYCDRETCRMGREHCQFACKRGNLIYVYCNVHGLMKLFMNGF